MAKGHLETSRDIGATLVDMHFISKESWAFKHSAFTPIFLTVHMES